MSTLSTSTLSRKRSRSPTKDDEDTKSNPSEKKLQTDKSQDEPSTEEKKEEKKTDPWSTEPKPTVEKEKSGWGVKWYTKFIRVPTNKIQYLWTSIQNHKLVYRNSIDKKEFTMVPQPGNRFVTAIRMNGDTDGYVSEEDRAKEKNKPLVSFRDDKEVIKELRKVAGQDLDKIDDYSNFYHGDDHGDEHDDVEDETTYSTTSSTSSSSSLSLLTSTVPVPPAKSVPPTYDASETEWLEINVKATDILPYINAEGMYQKYNKETKKHENITDVLPPAVVNDSDEALWKLYFVKQRDTMKKLDSKVLDKGVRMSVAKEMFLRDVKLHQLAKDINAALKRDANTFIDDHNGGKSARKMKMMTVNSKETVLLYNGPEAKYHRDGEGSTGYGTPMMRVERRVNDSNHRDHDNAWISIYNYCGNPYYIKKSDGKIHLSTCASGKDVQLTSYPKTFAGCLDASGWGSQKDASYRVQRHVSISVEELEEVLVKIDKEKTAIEKRLSGEEKWEDLDC
jgi:hypothetical protein